MNLYQFIASIVQSLVSLGWPLAFGFAVWLFRRELAAMIPRMRVKYKDFDVSFRLEEAEKTAKALPPPTPDAIAPPTPEEKDRFDRIAEASPRAAILELRNELETIVLNFARTQGVKLSPLHTNTTFVARVLRQDGKLDSQTSLLFDDLRVIGNAAAHDTEREFTAEDARRFKSLFEVVVSRLRGIESGFIEPQRREPK